MKVKDSSRFYKVPGDKAKNQILKPYEALVYVALRSFEKPNKPCNPSIKDLIKITKLSQPTINKNINILEENGYIDVIKSKGTPNAYKFLKPQMKFEKFSPDFLYNDELTAKEKAYWLVTQQFTIITEDNEAKSTTYSNRELSTLTGMDARMISQCEKSFEDKGFLVHNGDEKRFEVSRFGQAVALILTKHDNELKEHRQDIDKIKEENMILKNTIKEMNKRLKKLEGASDYTITL